MRARYYLGKSKQQLAIKGINYHDFKDSSIYNQRRKTEHKTVISLSAFVFSIFFKFYVLVYLLSAVGFYTHLFSIRFIGISENSVSGKTS